VATDPHSRAASPDLLREAAARRLYRRSVVTGQVTVPAVPSMIDEYMTMCAEIFAAVGRRFTAEQLDHVRSVLEGQLAAAYAASQRSSIVISYNAPVGTVLNYTAKPEWVTIEGAYENWIATREPPLFGVEPDARVWAVASEAADPGTHRVLDIGAGTGRNALALARRGHPVDVVEVTAKFADMIRADAAREALDVRVIQRDVFTTRDDLRQDYQLILLSAVVPEFRTTQHLRGCSNSPRSAWLPADVWCSTPS
jgi:Methyltransferase domain